MFYQDFCGRTFVKSGVALGVCHLYCIGNILYRHKLVRRTDGKGHTAVLMALAHLHASELSAVYSQQGNRPPQARVRKVGAQSQPNMQWALRRLAKPFMASELPSAGFCR